MGAPRRWIPLVGQVVRLPPNAPMKGRAVVQDVVRDDDKVYVRVQIEQRPGPGLVDRRRLKRVIAWFTLDAMYQARQGR